MCPTALQYIYPPRVSHCATVHIPPECVPLRYVSPSHLNQLYALRELVFLVPGADHVGQPAPHDGVDRAGRSDAHLSPVQSNQIQSNAMRQRHRHVESYQSSGREAVCCLIPQKNVRTSLYFIRETSILLYTCDWLSFTTAADVRYVSRPPHPNKPIISSSTSFREMLRLIPMVKCFAVMTNRMCTVCA